MIARVHLHPKVVHLDAADDAAIEQTPPPPPRVLFLNRCYRPA
jgi:hypothetical protein